MVAQIPPNLFREEALQHRLARNSAQSLLNRSPWTYPLTIVLVGLVVAVILVLALTHYKITETARGSLMAQRPAIQLVAPQMGVVEQVLVTNGQLVDEGTVLATVSSAVFDEAGKILSDYSLHQLEAETTALNREEELKKRLLSHQIAEAEDAIEDYHDQLALAEASLLTLNNRLDISEGLLQASETLLQQGALPQVQYAREQLAMLQLQSEYQTGLARKFELSTRLNQSKSKIDSIKLEWEEEQSQLTQRRSLLEIRYEQVKNQETLSVIALRKGVVASIPISVGDSVAAGEPLIYLQPHSEELTGEVFVPPSIMGMLAPGQELLLSYDGFDVQKYGRYPATVVQIDRASIDPREHQIPLGLASDSVFRVQILPKQHYVEGEDIFALQPGFQFTAEFVSAEMTLIEYIFRPLLKLRGKFE